jgi:hypothetical protein
MNQREANRIVKWAFVVYVLLLIGLLLGFCLRALGVL